MGNGTIVIRWGPNSEGGAEAFEPEELDCETAEEFDELDEAEQMSRMCRAIDNRNNVSGLCFPVPVKYTI